MTRATGRLIQASRQSWLAALAVATALALLAGCGMLPGASSPGPTAPAPPPTLLPPPQPITSPEPAAARASPSPVAAPPTAIPPPSLSSTATPVVGASMPRVRVANTDGQGANLRADPAPAAPLVRTVREGTELEIVGDDRESGGRRWRHVRDPAADVSGWIVAELLQPMVGATAPTAAPLPVATARAGASPPAGSSAAGPVPASGPSGQASPQPSGPSAAAPSPAGPSQRIGDADRAYLTVLQAEVDALGKAIASANEQIERANGRPDSVADAGWRQETQATAQALGDAAAKIRAAGPGPATGAVRQSALAAADRADEAAAGLKTALDARDPRALSGVRISLVRVLAEINNMNLKLLDLQ